MNLAKTRNDFPILKRKINGHPLIYFDNASTTQKPRTVIEALSDFYLHYNSNIHRGIHTLSQEATDRFEAVRDQMKVFLNAKYREEIIFTSGATESLNLVAFGLANDFKRGDEIILSEAEHHSNIVPWQITVQKKRAKIQYVSVDDQGKLDLEHYKKLLSKKTKVVAITHASNVLGTITPIQKIITAAHKKGALVVVDAAQSIAHLPMNVQKLDCDFLAFSGHKMYGPTGIGVLYGKKELLQKLSPYKYGGHMIERVTKEKTTFAPSPEKFEGGTAPIAEVIGLGAALAFVQSIGWQTIQVHDQQLTRYALKKLHAISGLRLVGPADARNRLPIFSFTLEGIPAHDIASLLDSRGIAVRSGHHCTQVLHARFKLEANTRVSLGVYNTTEEIDRLAAALEEIKRIFHV